MNRYVWSQLLAKNVLSASKYVSSITGAVIIPFTPAQEDPYLANTLDENPYIVFDLLTMPASTTTSDAWWVERDELTYAIHGPDIDKLDQIVNCIKESCRRFDESAAAVNRTAGLSGKYHFQTVCVEWVEKADASKNEAGRVSQVIQISYNYIRKEDSVGNYQ